MYQAIRGALESIPALAPVETPQGQTTKIIPLSDLVTALDAPFVMLASVASADEKALDGTVMWTDERFELAFEAETIDECVDICSHAQDVLEALEGTVTASGKHIDLVECSRTKNDGLNQATMLMTRPLTVDFRWWQDD